MQAVAVDDLTKGKKVFLPTAVEIPNVLCGGLHAWQL